jgi:exopolysaccharide/PEP-CTERM locus tyrosine autokinase
MSLVEQAIARLRNQATAAKSASDAAIKPTVPAPIPGAAIEPPKAIRRLTVNNGALRAAGYLPEEGKDRLFADHYSRIKRPLVDRALSGAGAIGEPRVIMITSSLPGDGKTFTSINLALSMALELDFSVLLVDCDVAKRHVSKIFGIQEEDGLLEALVDDSVDVESLVMGTNLRGLSILPAGKTAGASAELLSSNRMRQIVAGLCARAPRRILLLDSPPLLITNEGRALVKMAGQVVLVVRAGHTPCHAVEDATALFDPQQAGGIVLNHVQMGLSAAYYGYGSYGADGDDS